jgi:lipoate-protein ligase B
MKRERVWHIVQLGTLAYGAALDLQHRMIEARYRGMLETDTVLLLEHEPVFTLGHKGGMENLKVPSRFIDRQGIQVVRTERGGNITYHGPGQIVAYPIIHMKSARLGVAEYVEGLEEVMIRTAGDWGVSAQRSSVNHGVWVGPRKLGSVGIAIRRGIAFHGMALNVNLSLEPFSWINPCGLAGFSMTSLKEEGAQNLDMVLVEDGVIRHTEAVFGIRTVQVDAGTFERDFLRQKGCLCSQK